MFHIEAALLPNDSLGRFLQAAGFPSQNPFNLRIGNGQAQAPPDLLLCFVNTADHAQLQAAAGRGVWHAVVQTHQIHRPAADVHKQDGRFVPDELRVHSKGGIPLREQLYFLNGHFVESALKPEAHRARAAGRMRIEQVIPKGLLFPAEGGQRKAGGKGNGTFLLAAALFDFLRNGGQGQQIVIFVFCLIPQDRLAPCPAHIKPPVKFQRILQRVGFVGIF